MSETTRKLLNTFVDAGFTASIGKSSLMSALLRWGEDELDADQKNTIFPRLKSDEWFMFEIGRNCGTVFSADIVDSIEIKDSHCIIHLKQ